MCFIGVTRGDIRRGANLRARDKVSVFLRFSGCAFLTYYSRDSAISAQNALHEKRTLPGVSVYNVYCKQFTYFSTNYAPVMPPHSVSRPLHRGNLISVSLNKRTLVSPPVLPSVRPPRGVGDVIPRAPKRRYIFLNRKVPSTCSVCATFRVHAAYR